MRNAILKVALLLVSLLLVNTGSVAAVSTKTAKGIDAGFNQTSSQISFLIKDYPSEKTTDQGQPEDTKSEKTTQKATSKKVKPASKKHIVSEGETLITIASKHKTSWRRIFDKNTKLENPDVIQISQTVIIPHKSEKLKRRKLPFAPQIVNQDYTLPASTPAPAASAQVAASTPGNTYSPGYCTWYVKNRRPDIPNMLGDAISWVASAQARGMATGSTPRAGAVGQEGNHVVYIERVNKDGTVLVSEMNYHGLYVTSQRTAPASNFIYIY